MDSIMVSGMAAQLMVMNGLRSTAIEVNRVGDEFFSVPLSPE